MKLLFKTLIFTLLLTSPALLFASDCSVGYAHMKNGKFKLAYTEFRELAERGYPIYMNMIGDMHLKGQGVAKSKTIAHIWYSLAAAEDDKEGIQRRDELAKTLTAEQLSDSKYFAKEYAKSYLEPYISEWSLN